MLKKIANITFFILPILFGIHTRLTAQVTKPLPIKLIHADSLVGINTTDERIKEVEGHVEFIQGDVKATCDRAINDEGKNSVKLIGSVVITQQNLVLKAPLINYDGNSRLADAFQGVTISDQKSTLKAKKGTYSTKDLVADFTEDVTIEDDSANIWADRIVYHKLNRNSYAYGNVLIKGKFTNALLNSDTLQHYPALQYTLAYGTPLLFQIDTVNTVLVRGEDDDSLSTGRDSISTFHYEYKFDTLTVSSDTMEAFRSGEEFYKFTGGVEITRGSVAAIAKEAVYNRDREFIALKDTPVVWYDSTQLHGDSISIIIPGRKLRLIHAMSNALAASRNDTADAARINQITGDDIQITFVSDTINGIGGYGNAKSLYFHDNESGDEGASRFGSDTILIHFDSGEAENISWLGGIDGEFIPQNLITGSIRNYYLPLFRWTDERPGKKEVKLRFVKKEENNK